jgi:hypothetical protein
MYPRAEINAVIGVLDQGRPLDGLPPTFVPAVARTLINLLAALPRPVRSGAPFFSPLDGLPACCGLDVSQGVPLTAVGGYV